MITITDRNRSGEFAAWYQSQGIPLVLTALGWGTATTEILDCLGLEATEKAVLLLAAPRSGRLVRKAARELWLDVPGRGILMAVPISSVGGGRARDYLPGRVEQYAGLMGLRPAGISITGARKRFGSCSAKNRICFSWRLMQYPEAAIDYVVVHELAHIRHKNHGPDFYAFVEEILPDWRERRALLKE